MGDGAICFYQSGNQPSSLELNACWYIHPHHQTGRCPSSNNDASTTTGGPLNALSLLVLEDTVALWHHRLPQWSIARSSQSPVDWLSLRQRRNKTTQTILSAKTNHFKEKWPISRKKPKINHFKEKYDPVALKPRNSGKVRSIEANSSHCWQPNGYWCVASLLNQVCTYCSGSLHCLLTLLSTHFCLKALKELTEKLFVLFDLGCMCMFWINGGFCFCWCHWQGCICKVEVVNWSYLVKEQWTKLI